MSSAALAAPAVRNAVSAAVNARTTRGQRAAARSRPASTSRDGRALARELDGERDPSTSSITYTRASEASARTATRASPNATPRDAADKILAHLSPIIGGASAVAGAPSILGRSSPRANYECVRRFDEALRRDDPAEKARIVSVRHDEE